ncbi:S8 family serine peptidase [Metabacillus iocasae]|uniref:Minor extracellular serine protease Vpr n=1 Tax=Priestia iocasae TaxID=2291674 RepID=A0ABS2QXZ4_9BACI|nr:S8 family serine peptidase [Metabacillus iocasae]MBM7704058.1 minor extracellular serine protease Vpr [Metabacillus iocasae]
MFWSKWMMLLLLFITTGQSTTFTFPDRPLVQDIMVEKEETKIFLLRDDVKEAKEMIKKKYPTLRIRTTFQTAFSGLSIKGTNRELNKVAQEPFVQSTHALSEYKVTMNESVPFIGSEQVRGLFDEHHHRLTGEGVKVGVIDTGVDFTHPDLRRNYIGGYDVIDKDYKPMETLKGEGDPTIHGTHVAGVIAANGKMRGVAPEAEIYAYRALGPGGVGTSESVILAVEKAIQDGVDVINLSLGNEVNGPDLPTSLALNKATEKGIVTVTSSGNSGPDLWTVGSPGTASKAISVGASLPPVKLPYLQLGFDNKKIEVNPLQGSIPWAFTRGYEVIDGGIGEESDLTSALGKVVLVERGELSFTQKARNAEKAGAIALIIGNNLKGSFLGALEQEVGIPVVSISKENAIKLKEGVQSNVLLYTRYAVIQDFLASFSSKGPVTSTWDIKPDIVAPGYSIDSTVPGGYVSMHGTSMAAPHVAGACALLLQAHPEWSPEQVKAALMNTAKPLFKSNGKRYAPYEQGTGRIQVDKAIQSSSLIYPSTLSYRVHKKDKPLQLVKQVVTIDNQSSTKQMYKIESPHYEPGLTWKFPLSFVVGPKEKKQIEIGLEVDARKWRAGMHDGVLRIQSNKEVVEIPYLFIIEEPDYPRVMGFQFVPGDKKGEYIYELFLPEGADEVGIALYHPDTLRFVTYLGVEENVERGTVRRTVQIGNTIPRGMYKAIVFAKKNGHEDTLDVTIEMQ